MRLLSQRVRQSTTTTLLGRACVRRAAAISSGSSSVVQPWPRSALVAGDARRHFLISRRRGRQIEPIGTVGLGKPLRIGAFSGARAAEHEQATGDRSGLIRARHPDSGLRPPAPQARLDHFRGPPLSCVLASPSASRQVGKPENVPWASTRPRRGDISPLDSSRNRKRGGSSKSPDLHVAKPSGEISTREGIAEDENRRAALLRGFSKVSRQIRGLKDFLCLRERQSLSIF